VHSAFVEEGAVPLPFESREEHKHMGLPLVFS
jgi:hypothetical protein